MSRLQLLQGVENAARELVLTAYCGRGDPQVQAAPFHALARACMDARQDHHIEELAGEIERRPEGISPA